MSYNNYGYSLAIGVFGINVTTHPYQHIMIKSIDWIFCGIQRNQLILIRRSIMHALGFLTKMILSLNTIKIWNSFRFLVRMMDFLSLRMNGSSVWKVYIRNVVGGLNKDNRCFLVKCLNFYFILASEINCGPPPEKPFGGSYDWNGVDTTYLTNVMCVEY